MVSGQRHLPRSTMLGRVDLPDTVMYCFRATTKSDRYRMMMAMRHQEYRQTRRVADALRAQAVILDDARGDGMHLARCTDDGRNAIAAHRSHKHQQRAGDQAGGHHGDA